MTEQTKTAIQEAADFQEYMRNARNDFGETIMKYFPHEKKPELSEPAKVWTGIRVASENILICFDQMRNKIKEQAEQLEEARKEIAELRGWKESAKEILSNIDLQECGKILKVPYGADISKYILPALKSYNAK